MLDDCQTPCDCVCASRLFIAICVCIDQLMTLQCLARVSPIKLIKILSKGMKGRKVAKGGAHVLRS